MSRPRDPDGFDAREPGEWREPDHLSGPDDVPGPQASTGRHPAGDHPAGGPPAGDRAAGPPVPGPAGSTSWQPPGWDLPTVEGRPQAGLPGSPSGPGSAEESRLPERGRIGNAPPGGTEAPGPLAPPGRGLFGPRRPRVPGAAEQVFRPETDPVGVQAWALHHGWVPSDGTGPEDAPLAELVRTAPVRPAKEDRPANVVRGRGMGLDLVAFDVVYETPRYAVPRWAVTAAPVLGTVPSFRLSPARLWKHRTGGLLQVPSGDPEFDTRWVLLAAADDPQLRRLVTDDVVRQLLLGTDDGDELWSAAGFVAAVRPDGHRPQLIEHHARVLAVVVGALAVAS